MTWSWKAPEETPLIKGKVVPHPLKSALVHQVMLASFASHVPLDSAVSLKMEGLLRAACHATATATHKPATSTLGVAFASMTQWVSTASGARPAFMATHCAGDRTTASPAPVREEDFAWRAPREKSSVPLVLRDTRVPDAIVVQMGSSATCATAKSARSAMVVVSVPPASAAVTLTATPSATATASMASASSASTTRLASPATSARLASTATPLAITRHR
jgi:hypothetical protein